MSGQTRWNDLAGRQMLMEFCERCDEYSGTVTGRNFIVSWTTIEWSRTWRVCLSIYLLIHPSTGEAPRPVRCPARMERTERLRSGENNCYRFPFETNKVVTHFKVPGSANFNNMWSVSATTTLTSERLQSELVSVAVRISGWGQHDLIRMGHWANIRSQ
jgi:hypothetical protein